MCMLIDDIVAFVLLGNNAVLYVNTCIMKNVKNNCYSQIITVGYIFVELGIDILLHILS